jgi:hypothetical protein
MSEHVKHWLDGLSVAAAVASLAAWLPPVAALLSIIWTVIRIFETSTVQGWIGKWRALRED